MTRDDPKVVVRELLRREWTPSESDDVTPEFRTGWRDDEITNVCVTVSNDEESSRSETGRSSLSGSDARRGTLPVDVWVNDRVVDDNPKKVVDDVRAQIDDILTEYGENVSSYNFDGVPTTAESYRYISYLAAQYMPEEPDDEEEPVKHRYRITVGYEYNTRLTS